MNLFHRKNGIIVACDLDTIEDLSSLVEMTCELDFIQGYKIGISLTIPFGVKKVTKAIRNSTSLPILYDHQKFGTDIPEICGGRILDNLKQNGISGIIIFPQSGPKTLTAIVEGCRRTELTPIVGGEMTHQGYLEKEGGYITDNGTDRMYKDATQLGVEYYVIPGTRLESMKRYCADIEKVLKEPKFLFPGIGKGQGGDIIAAFNAVKPHSSYAIVGRGIYAERDRRRAAQILWENVSLMQ
ncbi:MAG: orotidine 5'-phosphate decarboxylase [candidate division Zixibacteria bacterium]|nr:orotidine 5'-phosphate decarboxylase [candidate division Zixibacteria bacterium]